MSVFHIFRVPNLLVVAMTLWVVARHVLYPTLHRHSIVPNLAHKDFYLLVFLTMCITAGGYLFNDLQDARTDALNEKRSFIRTNWERKIGYWIYGMISIAPIPFAYSLAMEIHHPEYLWIYFMVVGVLLAYNLYLKRLALVGNLIVATLCAGVIGLLLLAETESLKILKEVSITDYRYLIDICWYYMVFAFLTNLIREIIKDVQDIDGDRIVRHRTLPIVVGIPITKWILMALQVGLSAYLSYWLVRHATGSLSILISGAALLLLPAVVLIYLIYTADEKTQFAQLSQYYKLWMILGILFLYIYIKYT